MCNMMVIGLGLSVYLCVCGYNSKVSKTTIASMFNMFSPAPFSVLSVPFESKRDSEAFANAIGDELSSRAVATICSNNI